MSGLNFAYRKSGVLPTPDTIEVLVGKSTTINVGDILLRTLSNTYTGLGVLQYPVVRPLLSGDTITSSNGLIGVSPFSLTTDSGGKLTSWSSPVTADGRGKLEVNNMYTNIFPVDPVSTYLRITIFSFGGDNVFAGLTATNDIANFYDQGRACGITASAAAFPANYTLNTSAAAANAPLIVEAVDSEHPQFNSANGGGRLFVSCLDAFYQQVTATNWAT